jgi:hypothetical protein
LGASGEPLLVMPILNGTKASSPQAVAAVEAATGAVAWEWGFPGGAGTSDMTIVAASEEAVFVAVGSTLVSLDAATGIEQWRATTPDGQTYADTAAVSADGATVVATDYFGATLLAYRAADGSQAWAAPYNQQCQYDILLSNDTAFCAYCLQLHPPNDAAHCGLSRWDLSTGAVLPNITFPYVGNAVEQPQVAVGYLGGGGGGDGGGIPVAVMAGTSDTNGGQPLGAWLAVADASQGASGGSLLGSAMLPANLTIFSGPIFTATSTGASVYVALSDVIGMRASGDGRRDADAAESAGPAAPPHHAAARQQRGGRRMRVLRAAPDAATNFFTALDVNATGAVSIAGTVTAPFYRGAALAVPAPGVLVAGGTGAVEFLV